MKKTSIENLDDYLQSIDILHECADYFTINISSPNTPGRGIYTKRNSEALIMRHIEMTGCYCEATT